MNRFWNPLVCELTPYSPGEQPRVADLVKLNTNESPLGPSPRALEAIRAAATDALRLYPDYEATALRAALAAYHGLTPDQVLVGNGSDEVLAFVFAALLKHDRPLLFPDVTYSFYPAYCRLFGVRYETVPLDESMRVNVADYRRPGGAIILSNPNAPTGIALPRAEIARLLADHPDKPVVIDEAYVDFGAETAVPLIKAHPNLLVVQTMSKSRALAGLRVGYALGDAGLIEGVRRVKDSFNSYPVDRLAQAGAVAAIEDEAYFQASRAMVMRNRETLERRASPRSAFRSCRRRRISSSPATKSAAAPNWRPRCASGRCWCAISPSPPRIAPYLRISVGSEARDRAAAVGAEGRF